MSWLKKLFGMSVNSINEAGENLVDSIADIRRDGNALIRKFENDVKSLTLSLKEAQTVVEMNKSQIKTSEEVIREFKAIANKAVRNEDDASARTALNRIVVEEKMIATYQSSNDALQPSIDARCRQVQNMELEIRMLRAEIVRMDVEEKSYKLRSKLNGVNNGNGGGIDLKYLRDRVERAKATCNAEEYIDEQIGVNTTKATYVETNSDDVEARLEALKKENSN